MGIINKNAIIADLEQVGNSKSFDELLHSGIFEEVHEINGHKILYGCYRLNESIYNYKNEYSAPAWECWERDELLAGVSYVSCGIILNSNNEILRGVTDIYHINAVRGTIVSNTQLIVKNDRIMLSDIYDQETGVLFLPYALSGVSDLWKDMVIARKNGDEIKDKTFISDMSYDITRANICNHALLEVELNRNNLFAQLSENLQASSIIAASICSAGGKIANGIINGAKMIAVSNLPAR